MTNRTESNEQVYPEPSPVVMNLLLSLRPIIQNPDDWKYVEHTIRYAYAYGHVDGREFELRRIAR